MRRIVLLFALAATVGFAAWAIPPVTAEASGLSNDEIVRLYSGGTLVGEWRSDGPGRVQGDAYVFDVQDGVKRLEVRVQGTYSVEEQR